MKPITSMQKKNRIAAMLTAVLLLSLLLCSAAPVGAADASFELHLLNVGQGLGVLVKADGHALLYDGGPQEEQDNVVETLKNLGVSSLDYIVVSHYDSDHLNGSVAALKNFGCTTVLSPDYTVDDYIYELYQKALQANGANVIHPSQGDQYTLGNAQITVVGPSSYDAEKENNRCVAIHIQYGSTSYLLCGDAQEEEEEDIVDFGGDLRSDVYVINHHGSASSSKYYLLDAVQPMYAMLSCAKDNTYGHPAKSAMKRIKSMGTSLFRTDEQGEIIAYSDGSNLWFNQDPCDDFSYRIPQYSWGNS